MLQQHPPANIRAGWRMGAAYTDTPNFIGVLILLCIPLLICGVIQLLFAGLDYAVFHDGREAEFLIPGSLVCLLTAIPLKFSYPLIRQMNIHNRDAMLFVSLTWWLCSLETAIPIFLIADISYTDAVFEAASALTTTGATVMTNLDSRAPTLLMYRQFLQWLGGLGVVIFVVAVLPALNIGGLRVFKAETPGPMKNEKLTPRITQSARALWYVYGWLTFGCAMAYWAAGMSFFDAFAHSFSTVSTGGFSTHDASMGYFNSPLIELVSDLFMVLGATSFGLHYRFLYGRKLGIYFHDEETHVFLMLILAFAVMVTVTLVTQGGTEGKSLLATFSTALFHVISFMTSTGFGAGNYTEWPMAAVFLLLIAAYLGGCSGSTAGGNKIVRNIIGFRVYLVQLKKLVHPYGVFAIKYNGTVITPDIRDATMGFLVLSAITSLVLSLMLMATGLDLFSAFTAVAACLNVLGPAFGELGSNFIPVSDTGTWILTFTMLLGRLEFFTMLALLHPSFWRT